MGAALVASSGRRTLWVAHRRELVHQAAAKLREAGLESGLVLAGQSCDPGKLVQVASLQTLRRLQPPDADLVVIDEAHHAAAGSYRFLFDHYPRANLVGLTATPFRTDGKGLGGLFQEIVVACHADELCANGVLVPPRVFVPAQPDFRNVKKVAGDFNKAQLASVMDNPPLVEDVVRQWQTSCPGQRTVVFAVNVQHSQHLVAQFRQAGVAAEHLDGQTPTPEREAVLMRLREGQTTVLSNCMLLTEGWDLPSLQCAVIARPTASLCLHLQMLGRVMRAAAGKTGAIVLDHAGNHLRLGIATQRLRYSLMGQVEQEPPDPQQVHSPRACQGCHALVLGLGACPQCGREGPPPSPRELVRFDGSDQEFLSKVKFWRFCEEERRRYGQRQIWSEMQFHRRFDQWPAVVNGELINPCTASEEQKQMIFAQFDMIRRRKRYQPGWSAYKYRDIFGCFPSKLKPPETTLDDCRRLEPATGHSHRGPRRRRRRSRRFRSGRR